ncbi:uroporphyrinogen decarboxylase family protein [Sporomusa sp. KB1]|jgi:uroporphyrinogen decarboxylase|uniref:uroporphyrinogen decarboxylase family protein n=1 Tax=Sporomusa sp. KB1 TaxID=943346 RepID=UPI0011A18FE1|nr:uroporphyrinogen decarboxylase family protein [Sporomusa sp. KB1]TWH47480.1 uroporphyrinogen decarboxylase [Sporomusa sp. KB1]
MKTTWKDEMTPNERFKAFATGKPLDRIPCLPLVTDQAFNLAGGSMAKYYHSATLMAEAQIYAFETYETDSVGAGPGLFGIAEAIGSTLTFPDNSVPYVSAPAISGYQDLEKMGLIDPHHSGRLPIILEALKIIQETVKDRVATGCSVGGPFTTAAAIRGTDKFLKEICRQPAQVHRLLQYATDNILLFIDTLCDMGIKPSLAEPTASGTLISAKHFREFAQPYLRQCADRISQRCGSGPFLHICGDTMNILDDMVNVGATVLSLDNQIDLTEAKDKVGHKICLAGNVKPYTLWRGTPQEVTNEVKECLQKAYTNPKGFMLSSGCGLSLGTPTANVLAMMDAARKYGKWPITPEQLA